MPNLKIFPTLLFGISYYLTLSYYGGRAPETLPKSILIGVVKQEQNLLIIAENVV